MSYYWKCVYLNIPKKNQHIPKSYILEITSQEHFPKYKMNKTINKSFKTIIKNINK